MTAILSPITNIFTMFFNGILSLVHGIGITDTGLSYVVAVFLLTLLVRLLVLPLNIKQMKSQAAMQEVQPEIAKLQKKYKNNPEKANQEMMKLYKEYKVNPMSGCLPLLIQMPILFALYYVFMNLAMDPDVIKESASFLFITNLWQPGQPYSIILAIISAATTYLSSYIMTKSTSASTPENPGMNMGTMNVVMAGMMGFMSLQFTPMLVLYWIIGNILQMVQTYFLMILPKKRKGKVAKVS